MTPQAEVVRPSASIAPSAESCQRRLTAQRLPLPDLHRQVPHARHTVRMGVSDVSYMVRGRSREECQLELDRLCQLLGATPTTAPMQATGPGWVARAVKQQAPAMVGEGLVEAG